eukprot:SAG31_NODE_1078_length_10032_cov_4.602034_6_plen_282_part_00
MIASNYFPNQFFCNDCVHLMLGHQLTGESTFDKPAAIIENADQHKEGSTEQEQLPQQKQQQERFEQQQQDQELPTGWTTAQSRSTGETYYVNTATGESQFEFPVAPTTLPTGWSLARSRSTSDIYYVNEKTGHTQFEVPNAPATTSQTEKVELQLPPGWERHISRTTGDPYYVDIWSLKSQFEFPAQPALPSGWCDVDFTFSLCTHSRVCYFCCGSDSAAVECKLVVVSVGPWQNQQRVARFTTSTRLLVIALLNFQRDQRAHNSTLTIPRFLQYQQVGTR